MNLLGTNAFLINMPITVEVSDEILKAIPAINEEAIPGLIELGAKQMRIEQALAIFKEGKISIWRASDCRTTFARDDRSCVCSWIQTTL